MQQTMTLTASTEIGASIRMSSPTGEAGPIDALLTVGALAWDALSTPGFAAPRSSAIAARGSARESIRTGMKSGAGAGNAEVDAAWSSLMVAAQAGDRAAYERLLRDCVPLIKRVARRAGIQADRLDDVVQDVLITLHRARQTYDPSRSFSAWLSVIAQRRAIDALRHRGRQDRREVFAPLAFETHPDETPGPDSALNVEQQSREIEAALAGLPPGQREAVENLAIRQLSLADAAAATGKTTGALKVNLHRALKALRARFGGEA